MAVLWDRVGEKLDVLDFRPQGQSFLRRGSGHGGSPQSHMQTERGTRWYDDAIDTRCRFKARAGASNTHSPDSTEAAYESYLSTKNAESKTERRGTFATPSRRSRLDSRRPVSATSLARVKPSGRNRFAAFGRGDSESDEDHRHPDHHSRSMNGLREVQWDDTPVWDRFHEGYGNAGSSAEAAATVALELSSKLRSDPGMQQRSQDSDAWWIGYQQTARQALHMSRSLSPNQRPSRSRSSSPGGARAESSSPSQGRFPTYGLPRPCHDPAFGQLSPEAFSPALQLPYPGDSEACLPGLGVLRSHRILEASQARLASIVSSHGELWENLADRRREAIEMEAEERLSEDWYRRANRLVQRGWERPAGASDLDRVSRFGDGYYAKEALFGEEERQQLGAALWERMKADQPGYNQEDWRHGQQHDPEHVGPVADSKNYLVGTRYEEPSLEQQEERQKAVEEQKANMAARITRLRYAATRELQRGHGAAGLQWLHESA